MTSVRGNVTVRPASVGMCSVVPTRACNQRRQHTSCLQSHKLFI